MDDQDDLNKSEFDAGADDPYHGAPRPSSPPPIEVQNDITQKTMPMVQANISSTPVIGATTAGKTFLLAALQQACMLSGGNGYQLSFVPKTTKDSLGRTTTELIRDAIQRIVSGDKTLLKADTLVSRYSFELECRASWRCEPSWMGRPKRTFMSIVDGPGGTLFPSTPTKEEREYQQEMISEVSSAENLVICIDSVRPRLTVLRGEFSDLVDRAGNGPDSKLRVKRLLLLLTKVDSVVERVLKSTAASIDDLPPGTIPTTALRMISAQETVTEKRLAELINPLDFARATLDQASLSLIRRSLHPSAVMGVGVCSSTGFYPDGAPFWDNSRSAIKARSTQSAEDRLRNWTPFGVEESILFLLTGRIGRTIRSYSLAEDRRASNANRKNRLRLSMPQAPWRTAR